MTKGIYEEIKQQIREFPEGTIFFTSDFKEIATLATIRKCLGRQVDKKVIRRIFDGIYEKPKYSKILNGFIPVDPEKVAYAIASKYHWTIAPCDDVALNKLGLSTQVPAVWCYISDGPYRVFRWNKIIIKFKHKTNREISRMSVISIMIVESLKTLGKENVNEKIISLLRYRLTQQEKDLIIRETTEVTSWVYDIIREVCK